MYYDLLEYSERGGQSKLLTDDTKVVRHVPPILENLGGYVSTRTKTCFSFCPTQQRENNEQEKHYDVKLFSIALQWASK
uniref:DDE_Tnp_1_7 domain-containing protein n=1 Tax=Strongyloides venezuelensis TaxID=75913 RepID=A0A0K0FK96_STRVS